MAASIEKHGPRVTEGAHYDPEVLARLGVGLLDAEQGDYVGMNDVLHFGYVAQPECDPRYAVRRLLDILGKRLPNDEAWAMWEEINRYHARAIANRHDLSITDAGREWYRGYGQHFEKAWWLHTPLDRRYFRTSREDSACGGLTVALGVVLPQLQPLIRAGFTSDHIGTFIARHKAEAWRLLVLRRGTQAEYERFMITMIAVLAGFHISDDQRAEVEEEIDAHLYCMAQPQPHNNSRTEFLPQKNQVHITRLDAALDYFKRLEMAGLDALVF